MFKILIFLCLQGVVHAKDKPATVEDLETLNRSKSYREVIVRAQTVPVQKRNAKWNSAVRTSVLKFVSEKKDCSTKQYLLDEYAVDFGFLKDDPEYLETRLENFQCLADKSRCEQFAESADDFVLQKPKDEIVLRLATMGCGWHGESVSIISKSIGDYKNDTKIARHLFRVALSYRAKDKDRKLAKELIQKHFLDVLKPDIEMALLSGGSDEQKIARELLGSSGQLGGHVDLLATMNDFFDSNPSADFVTEGFRKLSNAKQESLASAEEKFLKSKSFETDNLARSTAYNDLDVQGLKNLFQKKLPKLNAKVIAHCKEARKNAESYIASTDSLCDLLLPAPIFAILAGNRTDDVILKMIRSSSKLSSAEFAQADDDFMKSDFYKKRSDYGWFDMGEDTDMKPVMQYIRSRFPKVFAAIKKDCDDLVQGKSANHLSESRCKRMFP